MGRASPLRPRTVVWKPSTFGLSGTVPLARYRRAATPLRRRPSAPPASSSASSGALPPRGAGGLGRTLDRRRRSGRDLEHPALARGAPTSTPLSLDRCPLSTGAASGGTRRACDRSCAAPSTRGEEFSRPRATSPTLAARPPANILTQPGLGRCRSSPPPIRSRATSSLRRTPKPKIWATRHRTTRLDLRPLARHRATGP